MSFTINEKTIGIKGSSGRVVIEKCKDGILEYVVCYMKIPRHWIFKTEQPLVVSTTKEPMPVGKDGPINLDDRGFTCPRSICFWNPMVDEIGWYSWSSGDISKLIDEFREMGNFLGSAEAEVQFNKLYEGK